MAAGKPYIVRAYAALFDVQNRMLKVGALRPGMALRLSESEDGFYVAYLRDGEVWRTSGVIGDKPRDAYMWVRGFAHATFTLTEHAFMTGENVPEPFSN